MADPAHIKNSELASALAKCRSGFISLGIFSFFSNLLMLTGPLFMLQVYDRVLTSGSIPTLLALALLVAILYAVYGFLEFVRSRLLVRVGRIVNEAVRERVFDAVAMQALRGAPGSRSEPLTDLQTIRQFLQSNGPLAFLDMPWTPVYLAVIFLIHSLLGYASLIAAVILAAIAVVTEQVTRKHAIESQRAILQANLVADQCRSNIEAASVLGMVGRLKRRWAGAQDRALDSHMRASDRGGLLSGMSRTLRLVFQSAILGLGAYLAVKREVSPGAMIASSIIMSRALAPIEMAVSQWPQFQGFVRSWRRLGAFLGQTPPRQTRMQLPQPSGRLTVDNLSAYVAGMEKPIIGGVSFTLEPGDGLGIIGPTGAGKSTLARALVGAWPLTRGSVRLDGATPDQWDPDILMLLKQGLVQANRVFALDRERAQLEGEEGELIAQIASTKGHISEIKLQMIQLDDDARTKTLTDLREAEAGIAETTQRRTAAQAKLERTEIRAPRQGYVLQLAVHTIGGVIAPGADIMAIVPDLDQLVIDVHVRPEDIDQVNVGQMAQLRFPAFDQRTTPEVMGEVMQVAADLTRPSEQQPPYYAVRVRLDPDQVKLLGSNKLRPGMPAEAFIQTKERTPFSYLLQPLTDQIAHTFREG